MEQIKLAIIEDNTEIQEALIAFFSIQKEIELVATAKSIEEFLLKIDRSQEIHLLLLDIMLDGMDGISGISLIKQKWPNINIIINSVLEDNHNIFKALQQGAIGYLTKETSLENIKTSLIQASQGMSVMNSTIASQIIDYFSDKSSIIKENLTKKEMIVAESLKNGVSYKVIAIENKVTIDTIRYHVRNIYRKLQINSKGELIKMMLRKY